MSKRFTDTEKFNDKWYRKLPILQKVIWEYLLAECNHAGILEKFDVELMGFKIGHEITKEDLDYFKDRIIFISDSVVFIPKFIQFQYGKLNPESKVHSSVLKELKRYSIDTLSIELGKGIDTLSIGLAKSIDTLKNKNKNKNKDKDNISLYGEYNNVALSKENYDKLLGICLNENLLNELINSFSVNIEVGKERPYIADLPYAHYERLKSYYNYRKKYPDKFQVKSCDLKAEKAKDEWYKKQKEQLAAKGVY